LGGASLMKKLFVSLLSLGLIFSFTWVAESNAAVKVYSNCKALNADYPGGVAQAANVKNKGGKTKYKPFVSKALYDANKKSDRDKDFIACER
jgi:hypothetical protein